MSRISKNNKTIENAKMDSFRIIIEFLLSFLSVFALCGEDLEGIAQAQVLLYANEGESHREIERE